MLLKIHVICKHKLSLQILALYFNTKYTLCLDISCHKYNENKWIVVAILDYVDLPKMEGSLLRYSKVVKF